MIKDGLLFTPNFEDIDRYLDGGTRTEIINKGIKKPKGLTDGLIVRNILVWMHKHTKRINNGSDERKFKRSSTEILKSKERTGCCDSCTLFTSLARSAGIPTMQIITLSKKWGQDIDKGLKTGTSGHFFAGVYLKDIYGKSSWVLVDPDRYVAKTKEVDFRPLSSSNRNIGEQYIFAYVKDYFDDLGIDSISTMANIQLSAYKKCNKKDFDIEKEER